MENWFERKGFFFECNSSFILIFDDRAEGDCRQQSMLNDLFMEKVLVTKLGFKNNSTYTRFLFGLRAFFWLYIRFVILVSFFSNV